MPTTDPVKRRKQNCENQKRWRQRQVDALERLTTALDESETRSKQLETEAGDLQDALRKARDEIKQLRATNQSLLLQIRNHPRGNVSRSVNSEHVVAGAPSSMNSGPPAPGHIWSKPAQPTSIGMPREGTPLTNIWRACESIVGISETLFTTGLNTIPAESSTILGDSGDCEHEYTSTNNTNHGNATQYQAGLLPLGIAGPVSTTNHRRQSHGALPFHTASAPGHTTMITQAPEPAFPAYLDPSAPFQPGNINQWLASTIASQSQDTTAFPNEQESDERTEEVQVASIPQYAQLPTTSSSYVDNLHFTWSPESVFGGTGAIRQNMANFPEASRLSGHILAMQNILYGVLPQLMMK